MQYLPFGRPYMRGTVVYAAMRKAQKTRCQKDSQNSSRLTPYCVHELSSKEQGCFPRPPRSGRALRLTPVPSSHPGGRVSCPVVSCHWAVQPKHTKKKHLADHGHGYASKTHGLVLLPHLGLCGGLASMYVCTRTLVYHPEGPANVTLQLCFGKRCLEMFDLWWTLSGLSARMVRQTDAQLLKS